MKILPGDNIYLFGPIYRKAPLHQKINIFKSVKYTRNPTYPHAP